MIMTRIQHFLLVCLLILATSGLSLIAATVHFTGFTENTGSNLTLVVPTTANPKIGLDPLAAGDEIGVFTPGGLLIGAEVWDGVNQARVVLLQQRFQPLHLHAVRIDWDADDFQVQ